LFHQRDYIEDMVPVLAQDISLDMKTHAEQDQDTGTVLCLGEDQLASVSG
jgi:hypothetical protein